VLLGLLGQVPSPSFQRTNVHAFSREWTTVPVDRGKVLFDHPFILTRGAHHPWPGAPDEAHECSWHLFCQQDDAQI